MTDKPLKRPRDPAQLAKHNKSAWEMSDTVDLRRGRRLRRGPRVKWRRRAQGQQGLKLTCG
jgi:hypothetical protein